MVNSSYFCNFRCKCFFFFDSYEILSNEIIALDLPIYAITSFACLSLASQTKAELEFGASSWSEPMADWLCLSYFVNRRGDCVVFLQMNSSTAGLLRITKSVVSSSFGLMLTLTIWCPLLYGCGSYHSGLCCDFSVCSGPFLPLSYSIASWVWKSSSWSIWNGGVQRASSAAPFTVSPAVLDDGICISLFTSLFTTLN